MKKSITLEICIDSVQSAIAAEKGGAKRVELCDNLADGGTTPSAGMIEMTRKYIDIGLQVLIRPRRGDFLYSDTEFEIMKRDIEIAKIMGANGFVFGLLQQDGNIDMERTRELIELCRPMNVTFHRAFDLTPDPYRALEDLVSLGVDRILTSGQKQSAYLGLDLITELVKKAGGRLIILPGGGINEGNIREIVEQSGVTECHTSARKTVDSAMIFRRDNLSMGRAGVPEYENAVADAHKVAAMRNIWAT